MLKSQDLRCVFVCNEMLPSPWGGIGNYTLNMANAMSNMGVDTTVIGLYDSDLCLDSNFTFIKVKPLPILRNSTGVIKPGLRGFLHRRQLHQKLKSLTQQVGSWVVEWPDYQGLWLKSNQSAVEINKIHGPSFLQPYPGLPTLDSIWESRQYQGLENWSSVSQYYADWVSQKIHERRKNVFISYIPININIFRRQNLNSNLENPRITFCGNGNLRKNPISVAQAFSLLAEKHEKLRLTFAGNVKCIESEIRGVIAPQHQSRLEFKGLLTPEKVADLLNSTTVFCLPSEHESFGMAWVEAMACGVPVVAGAGSCAEEVITKDAGFIIDPHNPRQIAEVIGALLSNSELRSRVGSLGQKVVSDRYSAEVVAVRVLDWYISLLDRKKN